MLSKNRAARHLVLSALAVFLLLFASRSLSLWYSYIATDILYMDTALVRVLPFFKRILSAAAFGAAVGASVMTVYHFGKRCGTAWFLLHVAILFADLLAAFMIDFLGGAASGALLPLTLLVCAAEWLWNSLLSLAVLFTARLFIIHTRGSDAALLTASLVHMAGWLLLKLINIFDFLIEISFDPTAAEIASMSGDVLSVIVYSGGVVWLAALLFFFCVARHGREKSEEFTKNL